MGVNAKALRALAVVSIAVVVVGCGSGSDAGRRPSGGGGGSSELELPEGWLATGGKGDLPPLTAVQLQLDADLATLENGATVLAAACMAKLGYEYRPTLVPVRRGADPFGAGDLDPARTRTEGYGEIVSGSPLDPSALPIEVYEGSLPPAERPAFVRAFLGTERREVEVEGGGFSVPADGCLAEARRSIGGDAFVEWSAARAAVEEATGQAAAGLEDSEEWARAEHDWSSCMAEDGYHYAGNGEAIADALVRFGGEEAISGGRVVSGAEIAMATADATCRRRAGFTATTIEVQGPLERQAMASVEGPILAWMEGRETVLDEAEGALRTGGGG